MKRVETHEARQGTPVMAQIERRLCRIAQLPKILRSKLLCGTRDAGSHGSYCALHGLLESTSPSAAAIVMLSGSVYLLAAA
jgi:hypothetical protein